jgi:SAM-dependent methyltransferase
MEDRRNSASNEGENTYLLDPESPVELARLINLDHLATQAAGGPLAGLTEEEIAGLRNVVDLACGPGGWVLDVAFALPDVEVAGVDTSRVMIDYANARARSQGLTNASFGVMDITRPLDFADGAFDLVNSRLLVAVLRREAWEPFIAEATRVLRSGGILRLAEAVDGGASTSPALRRLNALGAQSLSLSGYGFNDGSSIDMTFVLPHLLRRAGYEDVRYQANALEFSYGTAAWADFYRQNEVLYTMARPMFVKLGLISEEEAERLHQQMLVEMQAPDFCGMSHGIIVWGKKRASSS